jgi:hypothetical protein
MYEGNENRATQKSEIKRHNGVYTIVMGKFKKQYSGMKQTRELLNFITS